MKGKGVVLFLSLAAFIVVSVFLVLPASAAGKPSITSISPKSGTQGKTVVVTIKGKNFSAKKSKNKVLLEPSSGINVAIKSASQKTLKVTLTIDSGAEIGDREIQVKVGTKKSNKKTFTVNSSADVVALTTTSDLGAVDAEGWSDISTSAITTTGNPATGGHGQFDTGDLITISLQAAHDDTYLYMRANWADSTENSTSNVWTYSDGAWSKSSDNEDRWFMMFPITDVVGREGKTFAEAGCAMTCHLVESSQVVTNTTDALSSCGICHPNSDTDPGASFEHASVTEEQSCSSCHADREFDKDGADMVSPADGAFDIWHWKAGRSAPINVAEDQNTVGPAKRGGDGTGLTSNNDATGGLQPLYIWTPASGKGQSDIILGSKLYLDGGSDYTVGELWLSGELAVWDNTNSKWLAYDTVLETETEVTLTGTLSVRRSIYRDDKLVEGSNKDLISDSQYSNGAWTVVIKRKLNTGDSKDVIFESDNTYNFGIAVTDNSGINHKGNSLKTLFLQ